MRAAPCEPPQTKMRGSSFLNPRFGFESRASGTLSNKFRADGIPEKNTFPASKYPAADANAIPIRFANFAESLLVNPGAESDSWIMTGIM